MTTEYLFEGTLRWSFGFDNPNKAAVLSACLLPLIRIAWDCSWRKSHPVAAPITALCLTYSRGGLVTATAAFAVAALFSTITDAWVLWILPLTAAAILTWKVAQASSLPEHAAYKVAPQYPSRAPDHWRRIHHSQPRVSSPEAIREA